MTYDTKASDRLESAYRKMCTAVCERLLRNDNAVFFLLGTIVLATGSLSSAFAQGGNTSGDGKYREACNRLVGMMETDFGALITAAAGIGAIVASSVGGFKMAWTLVVVAVGAFILRGYLTLFFQGC